MGDHGSPPVLSRVHCPVRTCRRIHAPCIERLDCQSSTLGRLCSRRWLFYNQWVFYCFIGGNTLLKGVLAAPRVAYIAHLLDGVYSGARRRASHAAPLYSGPSGRRHLFVPTDVALYVLADYRTHMVSRV